MEPEEAYLTNSLLRSVVTRGTGRRAQALGRPVAGKTGTTNAAKDAWFVGYSTDIVAGVWVGYDDARPLGPGESGSATALPAWVEFMQVAHSGKPKTDFTRPESIVTATIDPETGLLAHAEAEGAVTEEFLEGTVPTELAPDPEAADAGAASEEPQTARPPPVAAEPPPF
jgi:penicillin-binding protein 1A